MVCGRQSPFIRLHNIIIQGRKFFFVSQRVPLLAQIFFNSSFGEMYTCLNYCTLTHVNLLELVYIVFVTQLSSYIYIETCGKYSIFTKTVKNIYILQTNFWRLVTPIYFDNKNFCKKCWCDELHSRITHIHIIIVLL